MSRQQLITRLGPLGVNILSPHRAYFKHWVFMNLYESITEPPLPGLSTYLPS